MFIFSFFSCSALRANKGWHLTDLHVTSCLHSAAIAPASVNASTTKFCFPSRFLQPLPFCQANPIQENPIQSPWAGRDSADDLVPACAESCCLPGTSSGQAWSVPSPGHVCSDTPGSPSCPFWSFNSPSTPSPPTPLWFVARWEAAWGQWATCSLGQHVKRAASSPHSG